MYIFLVLLFVIIFIFFVTTPVTFRRVTPGDNYQVGSKLHTIPDIEINKPVFYLKSDVLGKMSHLLVHLHNILTENNIPYWITCGTLLGCIRHQGFIPWDDDIDINIELEHVSKLESILSGMEKSGYLLCTARGGYKFGYNNLACYPFVDIIIVNKKDNVFQLCYPLDENGECTYEVSRQWPDECFAATDVYPLAMKNFEDFHVFVPQNYEKLLYKIYGSDCLLAAGSRADVPYAYSLKSFPWLLNHYYDNILFRIGVHKG